jgi:hypothetical protein
MRPDVAMAFDRLDAAARHDGVALTIVSAFRSNAEQARLFAAHPDPKWVAPPGKSLHRLGTELDLGPASAYGWLAANAPRFGFIKRYSWEHWALRVPLGLNASRVVRPSSRPPELRLASAAIATTRARASKASRSLALLVEASSESVASVLMTGATPGQSGSLLAAVKVACPSSRLACESPSWQRRFGRHDRIGSPQRRRHSHRQALRAPHGREGDRAPPPRIWGQRASVRAGLGGFSEDSS